MSATDQARVNFDTFKSEVGHVLAVWTMWRRLYFREDEPSARAQVEAGDRTYRVTGSTARSFFYFTRWHLLRSVVLDLCRLGDKTSTGGQANLTIARVLDEAPFGAGPNGRLARLEVEMLNDGLPPMRTLRNKLIAHFDLDVATQREPAPSVPIDDIERVVNLFACVTSRIHAAWSSDEPAIQDAPPNVWIERTPQWRADVDRLVDVLEQGLRADTRAAPTTS